MNLCPVLCLLLTCATVAGTAQGNLWTPDLVSKFDYWSWADRGPQTYPVSDGHPEAMVITAATRPQGEPGEQPSPEVSKDTAPSKEFGRFYLDLLKQEIARFKDGKG